MTSRDDEQTPDTRGGYRTPPTWRSAHVRYLRQQSFLKIKRRKPPLTEDNITVVDPATLKRAISASALGNMMEWFDFGVYGYLAATLGKVHLHCRVLP